MSKARQQSTPQQTHAELPEDIHPELLKALHILTRDGALNADSRRKLKQVLHLLGLLAPAMEDILSRVDEPVVVDCGAGKGHLGFLLAQRFLTKAGKGRMLNIEARADICLRARDVARSSGLTQVEFVQAHVADAALPEKVDLVTALHACDTATDDALAMAVKHSAEHVAVVPCCQAEVAQQLKQAKDGPVLHALHAHAIHRREYGAHLTNVVRTLALEACGYSVTVTELVGWEHSLKNELILARRVQRDVRGPRAILREVLQQSGVRPKVVELLEAQGSLPPSA